VNVPDRLRNALDRVTSEPTSDGADGPERADSGPEHVDDADPGIRGRLPGVTRRRVLAGVLGVGAAKAADNVLVGYGILTGTNLLEQDLQALTTERLRPSPFTTTVDDTRLSLERGVLDVGADAHALRPLPPKEARAIDREHGFVTRDDRGPVEELAADWAAITADPARVEVRPQQSGAFFETIADADTRPYTVTALRGSQFEPATPETVRAFADVPAADEKVDPSDPQDVVHGLKRGFNVRTSYDGLRYVAGSVEDNVIMGTADLREHFEEPVTFDALLEQRDAGMFCYEFVFRSIDALHAVPAFDQTAPVFGGIVTDTRHKHVYTAIASAYRDGDTLVVPLTFVDYTHSTLYDDYAADLVLGEGLEAYNSRHRATDMYWHGYVGGI
jgi:hypothetical protein